MARTLRSFPILTALLLAACSSHPPIQSVHTSLSPAACKSEVDHTDPNDTPYMLCPGVDAYSLIVRNVDAGRQSIEIVGPSQQTLPLNYQDFVTRSMFSLDSQAEWRVSTKDAKPSPLALIVRVQAHEDNENPQTVTRTYFAVAKIARNQACVIASIPETATSADSLHRIADSAAEKPCASPLPPLRDGGALVR